MLKFVVESDLPPVESGLWYLKCNNEPPSIIAVNFSTQGPITGFGKDRTGSSCQLTGTYTLSDGMTLNVGSTMTLKGKRDADGVFQGAVTGGYGGAGKFTLTAKPKAV